MKELRDSLAEYAHDNWSRWEKYRARALTLDNLQMWWRKSETPFRELTKQEQKSDYDEADRILALLEKHGFDGRKKE